MKKIIIEIAGDSVAVSSKNLKELTEDDIALSIEALISTAEMLGVSRKKVH